MSKGSGEFKAGLEIDISVLGDENTKKTMEAVTSSVQTLEKHIDLANKLNLKRLSENTNSTIGSLINGFTSLALKIAGVKKVYEELMKAFETSASLEAIRELKVKPVLQKSGGSAYQEGVEKKYSAMATELSIANFSKNTPSEYLSQMQQLMQVKGLEPYKTIEKEDGTKERIFDEDSFNRLRFVLEQVSKFVLASGKLGQNVNFKDVTQMLASYSQTGQKLDSQSVVTMLNDMLKYFNDIPSVISSVTQQNISMQRYAPSTKNAIKERVEANVATGNVSGGSEAYDQLIQSVKSALKKEENYFIFKNLFDGITPKIENIDKIIYERGAFGAIKELKKLSKDVLTGIHGNTKFSAEEVDVARELFGGGSRFESFYNHPGGGYYPTEDPTVKSQAGFKDYVSGFLSLQNLFNLHETQIGQDAVNAFKNPPVRQSFDAFGRDLAEKNANTNQTQTQQNQVQPTQKVDVNVKIDASADMQEWIRIETEKKYGIPTYPIDRFNTMISNNNP